jgi:hypothetical protein
MVNRMVLGVSVLALSIPLMLFALVAAHHQLGIDLAPR